MVGAACGVPTSGTAHLIPAGQVPFGLLQAGQEPQPPAIMSPSRAIVDVFLVSQAGHLVARGRVVKAPVTVEGVVGDLLAGPTNAEAAGGLISAIPDRTQLRSARISFGVAELDLSSTFGQVSGANQVLAVAELVYTATVVTGVVAVAFSLDGKPVEVPDGNGTLSQGPVTRTDYAAVAPV